MAKRKLKAEYVELTDEGKILRVNFNRPVSRLEAAGIKAAIEDTLRDA